MTLKKKSASRLPAAELHFTTGIPIEMAAGLLAGLASDNVQVELNIIDDHDALDFTLKHRHQGKPNALVKGRLCRWQGTLTRVDCDGAGTDGILKSDFSIQLAFTLAMVALAIISIAYTVANGYIIVYDWGGAIIWFMTPIIAVAALSYWGAHQVFVDIYAKRERQIKRDLDKLMQQIVDSLHDGSNELVE